jgi:L-fuconolactonase
MNGTAIVDSHCHFWDPSRFHYAWNSGLPALDRSFIPSDLAAASAGVNLRKIVFVECDCSPAQSFAEADWVFGLAKEEPRLKGIVARAPVEDGEIVRSHLQKLANNPLVKGIRRNLQGERETDFCLKPQFIAGVKSLAEFGFTFDLCIRHEQLASVITLAREIPQVTFVLDHFGKPAVREEKKLPWAADLKNLAALPNVFCKISGLTTEADWNTWRKDDLKFYFDHTLKCFDFDRLLFGSDWPMATLATNYSQWMETVEVLFQFTTENERNKLFQANAERVYRV